MIPRNRRKVFRRSGKRKRVKAKGGDVQEVYQGKLVKQLARGLVEQKLELVLRAHVDGVIGEDLEKKSETGVVSALDSPICEGGARMSQDVRRWMNLQNVGKWPLALEMRIENADKRRNWRKQS